MIRCIALLLALALPLVALEGGQPIPTLDGVVWVDDQAPRAGLPQAILLITLDSPQAQQTAIELGRLQRQHRDRVQALAISADDLATFRRSLGVEAGYPAGRATKDIFTALTADARGLPHSLLIAADGTLIWQGHPRLLPRIIEAKLE